MSESTEQQAVVQWFRSQYPKLRLIAIPNGQWIAGVGKAKFALINKYKAEGLTNGVSDLFLAHSDGKHHGLWVEMKNVGKKLSDMSKSQLTWQKDMIKAGYIAELAIGQDSARKIITSYIKGEYIKE